MRHVHATATRKRKKFGFMYFEIVVIVYVYIKRANSDGFEDTQTLQPLKLHSTLTAINPTTAFTFDVKNFQFLNACTALHPTFSYMALLVV